MKDVVGAKFLALVFESLVIHYICLPNFGKMFLIVLVSQEHLKTILYGNFGGKQGVLFYIHVNAMCLRMFTIPKLPVRVSNGFYNFMTEL